ncbi:small ribosomal subunit protein uS15m [Rhineura floridana]|uniref:small ribosomal subunit protein uS15m n=1 Tax=Rhineura floridana TaxID=261503 RepID=UPI002AC85719|nr:small ribosomal subunit protein uS15m [Rhineura floridana]
MWPPALLLRGVSAAAARGSTALRGWSRLGPCVAASPGTRKSPLLQTARNYARPTHKKKEEIPSHLDDLPATMLLKDYAKVPVINKVDNVVRRLLSLEMANQREKVKIKKEQLAEKVRKSPNDSGSFEVQVAHLTAQICTLQEHLHLHPKDKVNRRNMMMAKDRRNMLLKFLRNRRYDVYENTCKQLGIKYEFPLLYRRRATRRWVVKKALCLKVFQEVQKLKAQESLRKQQGSLKRGRAAEQQALPVEGTPV